MVIIRGDVPRKSVRLFVIHTPSNVDLITSSYFILWLRDYRARYTEWQKQRNSPKDAVFAPTTASRLATFYSRAKNTFFIPNANYELNLPSSVLAPFQMPDQSIHPDPSLFQEVESETRRMLEQSLRRFIQAQMNNVGNHRVLCGIIAGIFIMLVGFLPPMIANFVSNGPRWLRLTAVPGMWLGLTILLCALHGVCLGVYILGDLRQLRKFELTRPAASRTSNANSRPHLVPQSINLPSSPTAAHGRSHRHRQKRPGSPISVSEFSDTNMSIYSREIQSFPMVPGYIETNPIEGPSTCPILLEYCNPKNDAEWIRQQELRREQEGRTNSEPRSPNSFTTTATFIAPFCSPSATDISGYWDSEEIQLMNARWYRLRAMEDLEKLGCEVRGQPAAEFDFDGLPLSHTKQMKATSTRSGTTEAAWDDATHSQDADSDIEGGHSSWDDEQQSRWKWLLDFFDRVQTRCSFKKWGRSPGASDSGPVFLGGVPPYLSSKASGRRLRLNTTSKSKSTLSLSTYATTDTRTTERVKKQSRLMNAVPAFAVPLTRILSPIIVRGQWEIVVRSSGLAILITGVVCGSLLAVPLR